MTSLVRSNAPEFAGAVQGLRDSVRDHVVALGWLDFDAGGGATHANLPSDVCIVTLQVAAPADAAAPTASALAVVITPVREQPRRYGVAGRSQIAVATLTVGGMFRLFGLEWLGRADRPVPLTELCSAARTRQLWAALQGSQGLNARSAAFGRWLEAGLLEAGTMPAPQARVARSALRLSHAAASGAEPPDLARLEGITRRQLERDFRRHLGLSPGAFARVARFQRAAAAVSAGAPLADSAALYGYADQAHLARSFKLYSGLTPRELAAQGARPGRELLRAGLAGRVILLDLPGTEAGADSLAQRGAVSPREARNDACADVAARQDRHPLALAKWAA